LDNNGKAVSATAATVTLDNATAHASQGTNSASVTVTTQPTGGWTAAAFNNSNGGVTDWSTYRYLKYDVKNTGTTSLDLQLILQSGTSANGWGGWCTNATRTLATGVSTTLILDLATCGAATKTDFLNVFRFQVGVMNGTTGTFNIDNVRLETLGTVSQLTGFETGIPAALNPAMLDDTAKDASAIGSYALDTTAANATEGSNSVAVTLTTAPAGSAGLAFQSNGGVADWTPYRHLIADIHTNGTVFNGILRITSGTGGTQCESNWTWVNANTAVASVMLDLAACPSGTNLANVTLIQILGNQVGTSYVDNLRLTAN
jgi:hypothetical protein